MSIELEKAGIDRFQKILKIGIANPVFCKESETIDETTDKMLKSGHRILPIVSRNMKLVGIITTMDILGAFLTKQKFNEKISTIMTRDVIFCHADDSIGYVLQKFKLSRRGGFPILHKDRLVGMVSERDFVKYFSNTLFGIKVEDVMTKKPFFVPPKISILDCLKSLVNTQYRRLPVVENKKLIGIVTAIDFLKFIKQKDLNILDFNSPIDLIYIKNVLSISKDKDVSDAIKLMKTKDIGGIPVINDKEELEGIITERDILEEIV